jgi:hypothetical protein
LAVEIAKKSAKARLIARDQNRASGLRDGWLHCAAAQAKWCRQ